MTQSNPKPRDLEQLKTEIQNILLETFPSDEQCDCQDASNHNRMGSLHPAWSRVLPPNMGGTI